VGQGIRSAGTKKKAVNLNEKKKAGQINPEASKNVTGKNTGGQAVQPASLLS